MNKKTQIISILNHNGISLYRFVKEMGFKPTIFLSRWIGRLSGEFTINKDEKKLMLKTLKKLTGSSYVDTEVVEVDKFRCI